MQVFARFCSASFSCQNSNKIPISHTVHPKIFSPTHTLRIVLLTFSLPSLRFTKKHTPPPFRGISFFFSPRHQNRLIHKNGNQPQKQVAQIQNSASSPSDHRLTFAHSCPLPSPPSRLSPRTHTNLARYVLLEGEGFINFLLPKKSSIPIARPRYLVELSPYSSHSHHLHNNHNNQHQHQHQHSSTAAIDSFHSLLSPSSYSHHDNTTTTPTTTTTSTTTNTLSANHHHHPAAAHHHLPPPPPSHHHHPAHHNPHTQQQSRSHQGGGVVSLASSSPMAVQQTHGLPQIDPSMMASPRQRVSELQRSDINQMSSGQLAKALGVIPEDRDAWNKMVKKNPQKGLCGANC